MTFCKFIIENSRFYVGTFKLVNCAKSLKFEEIRFWQRFCFESVEILIFSKFIVIKNVKSTSSALCEACKASVAFYSNVQKKFYLFKYLTF